MKPIDCRQLMLAGENCGFWEEFPNTPMGVCSFENVSDRLISCRAMGRIPPNSRSVIVFLFPYQAGRRGNLSRYASVPDYHTVVTPALERLSAVWEEQFAPYSFRPFCDNSPIPEVRAAAFSGLGVMGENGLLIHSEYGSWVFIGEMVTDAPVLPTGDSIKNCLRCGLCRRRCPGQALSEKTVEKEQCLSHISQKKGELTEREQDLLRRQGLAWGCDACQECCPMNQTARLTQIPKFLTDYRPIVEKGDAFQLENRAYTWRGPKVVERNLDLLKKEE